MSQEKALVGSMSSPGPAGHDSLGQRAYWLIRLRWFAAFGVVFGTFMGARVFRVPIQEMLLYGVAALLLFYNAAVLAFLNHLVKGEPDQSGRKLKSVVNFQISADLIVLTILLHSSGGPENPLAFFFVFHMIIASILLSVWESYLQATLAVTLFGLLLLLEFTGLLRHHCLKGFLRHCFYEESAYLAVLFATFATTLYLVVYMAGYVAVRLKRAEEAQRAANQQLREKDHIKDEYVAHLTHDIKGHLAAVQTCLGVAVSGSSDAEKVEFTHRAYRRTQKLTAFVRMLLRLTRLKLDGRLEMEVFSASGALREAVEAVRLAAQEKSLCLECSVAHAAAIISGNEITFKEAITNLLLNAIKYTPEHGTISVKTQMQAESVVIEIVDTGIGVPQDEQIRIFEEFYRASNARQREPDGDGLGLSLVKRVVELHGGTISFSSELGRGTTFRILLPLASLEQPPEPAHE